MEPITRNERGSTKYAPSPVFPPSLSLSNPAGKALFGGANCFLHLGYRNGKLAADPVNITAVLVPCQQRRVRVFNLCQRH